MAAIVTHVDDLYYHEENERQVQADETHVISVDGREFKVDLTAEHSAELLNFLTRYETAGEPVAMPGPATPKKKTHAAAPGDTPLKRAKLYRRRMRAFADSRPDLGKASYLTEGGNHQYTDRLEKAYAAYEAEHGPYPLPGEPGYEAVAK
jgi:hypothetical protein